MLGNRSSYAFSLATNVPVHFCNPASLWQRGSSENTNGLLRQYFSKGTAPSVHTDERLAAAAELTGRPRKTQPGPGSHCSRRRSAAGR